jgi:hypothetical protein
MSVASHEEFEQDNMTVSSKTSQARNSIECPECKKEMQSRHMFNHIVKFHPGYFEKCYTITQVAEFDDLYSTKYAKGFPVSWDYLNDFDESESKTIWGCLACNSTFTTEMTAQKHCSNKKCMKDHVKQIKQFKKDFEKDIELNKKRKKTLRDKYLARTADIIYKDANLHKDYIVNIQLKKVEMIKDIFQKILEEHPEYQDQFKELMDFKIVYPEYCSYVNDKEKMLAYENKLSRYSDMCYNFVKDSEKCAFMTSVISETDYYNIYNCLKFQHELPKFSYD